MSLPPADREIDPKWARWAVDKLLRFYLVILIAAGILCSIALDSAEDLNISTNLEALMPEGVPSVENLHRVLEKTGSFSNAMVAIHTKDRDASLKFAKDLQTRVLDNLDWVASAHYSEDISLFERHKLLYMETADLKTLQKRIADRAAYEQQNVVQDINGVPVNIRIRTQPTFEKPPPLELDDLIEKYSTGEEGVTRTRTERLFRSDDAEVTVLVVWPSHDTSDLTFSRQIITDLEAVIAEMNPGSYASDMQVGVGGRIRNRVAQFDAVNNDVKLSGMISFALIAALLIGYFRSALSIVYIVVPLAIGIVWTMGIAQYGVGGLNLVTVFLVLILFGLGVDFGIHNLSRYLEVRRAGGSLREGLVTIMSRTSHASAVAATTTAAGFFSLMFTEFRAFYEFGFIAGAGILCIFVAMYTVFPAGLILAEKLPGERATPCPKQRHLDPGNHFPWTGFTIAMTLFAIAVSFVAARQVQFEDNFKNLEAEKSASHQEIDGLIQRVFSSRTDRAVLYVETLEEVRAIEEYFTAYIAQDTDTPTIEKVESFYTYVPKDAVQRERLAIISEINESLDGFEFTPGEDDAPENWQEYLDIGLISPDDLPEGLSRIYRGLGDDGGHLVYIFNSVDMNQAVLAQQFSDDVREIEVGGKLYHPATEGLIFVDMMRMMKSDAVLAIVLVVSATCLVIFAFFRRISDTLIVLAPTAAGMAYTFGLMGVLGIKLSVINMVILPSIIGIGVDNGIHIYHRYRESESRRDRNVMFVLRTTGLAAAITTLTTMLGFAGMFTASMAGLRSLGGLAIIGFSSCLFATWTLMPALMQWRRDIHDARLARTQLLESQRSETEQLKPERPSSEGTGL